MLAVISYAAHRQISPVQPCLKNKMGNKPTLISGYLLKKKTMIEMVDMKRTPKVQICDERPLISK